MMRSISRIACSAAEIIVCTLPMNSLWRATLSTIWPFCCSSLAKSTTVLPAKTDWLCKTIPSWRAISSFIFARAARLSASARSSFSSAARRSLYCARASSLRANGSLMASSSVCVWAARTLASVCPDSSCFAASSSCARFCVVCAMSTSSFSARSFCALTCIFCSDKLRALSSSWPRKLARTAGMPAKSKVSAARSPCSAADDACAVAAASAAQRCAPSSAAFCASSARARAAWAF